MRNKYIKVTHISERKTREIIRLFCLDIEAEKTSVLTSISRPTINRFYRAFRERIAELCEAESPFTNGEVELDESYFGARRVRGIRGRGARGKTPVFGMLKRGDKVYTQIVKNCSISELLPIIKGRTDTVALSPKESWVSIPMLWQQARQCTYSSRYGISILCGGYRQTFFRNNR